MHKFSNTNFSSSQKEILFNILYEIALAKGNTFFDTIVESISNNLGVQYVLIGEFIQSKFIVKAKSLWANGNTVKGYKYSVQYTPCEHVLKGETKVYPRQLQPMFPKDLDLVDWQIESYIGVPLLDSQENIIGHIAVMHTQTIEDVELVKTVLKTCSHRVEAELERAIKGALVQQQKDEKKIQIKQLAHSSSVLAATIESTTDGLLIVNTKGEMLQFNQKFLDIWNIPPEIFDQEEKKTEKPTASLVDTLLPQLKKPNEFLNRLREIYAHPESISTDIIYFNDGRIIERYSQPHKNEDKIVGRIWSFRDITKRIKTEQELRKSEFLFRSLFEESPIGIVIDNYDHTRLGRINKKFSRMLQYPMEKLMYMKAADITHPDDMDKHIQSFREIENQNISDSSFEKRYIAKNGDIIWANVSISTVRDESNKSLYRVLMIQDITEKKKALLELAQKNKELQKYIDSNMQLENFAYIASHDLREPLLTTMGLVELLRDSYADKLNEEAQSFLAFIDQSVKNMDVLINDLLTYSRVNTQKHTVSTFNLQALLQSTLGGLQNAIDEQKAVIKTHNIPQIFTANETKMTQLFQNLIANAIKFRKENIPPAIQIVALDCGDTWQFSISDNGIGVDPKFHNQIFVLFKKLHSRHEYKGTGIGLATCKKIVEQHGGKIWLESELDKGTTFHFTIPKF